MLISAVFTAYETDKRILGFSKHTLKAYRLQSDLLIRAIGDIDIADVDVGTLKTYLARDAERLKPSSIGHRVRFLRSLFRWAHEEALISGNPAAKLREPKQGVRIPKFLTQEVVEELRISCESTLERAIIEFFYATGCRISEVVSLNHRDIDFQKRSVVVHGKGDREREVYFTTRCAIMLRRYLRGRADDDPALFVTERDPHRMSVAQMRYIVKRVAKRAEIDANVYPHRLRHSFATHMLENGAPLEAIQSFLGHARMDTTRIYAQLSGDHRRELYRKYSG